SRPPAPGRLSMMICFPQISVRRWATVRAMRSFDAPGANPTTHRIGFEGNPGAGSGAAARPVAAQNNDKASSTAFMDPPVSLDLDPGRFHHLRPFLRLALHERDEFPGRAGHHEKTLACE